MRKLILLLAVLAALCCSVGTGAALATPNYPWSCTQFYQGGDGTGRWYTGCEHLYQGQLFQIRSYSYILVDGSYYRDSASALDIKSEETCSDDYCQTFYYMHNTPSSCPYPGFHTFKMQQWWQYRQWVAALGQWTSWSAQTATAPTAGQYAQVCL